MAVAVAMGTKPGGTAGVAEAEKISASWRRVASWLSLVGDKGEAGDGWSNAAVRSQAAAMAASLEEAEGMWTFDGNHARVSAMRSAIVSTTQTRKQR